MPILEVRDFKTVCEMVGDEISEASIGDALIVVQPAAFQLPILNDGDFIASNFRG